MKKVFCDVCGETPAFSAMKQLVVVKSTSQSGRGTDLGLTISVDDRLGGNAELCVPCFKRAASKAIEDMVDWK